MVRLSNVGYWCCMVEYGGVLLRFGTVQLSKVGLRNGKVRLGFAEQGCGAVMLCNVKEKLSKGIVK